jgi:hypothetical protein
MSTILGLGWQAIAGIGAVVAVVLAWLASNASAKKAGVAQQQAADLQRKVADDGKASEAVGSVAALDDDAAIAELHRDYDRTEPVRVGPGNQRVPGRSADGRYRKADIEPQPGDGGGL